MTATDSTMSGKFLLRLPKSLHARLIREAEAEGVSLNSWCHAKLSLPQACVLIVDKAGLVVEEDKETQG